MVAHPKVLVSLAFLSSLAKSCISRLTLTAVIIFVTRRV